MDHISWNTKQLQVKARSQQRGAFLPHWCVAMLLKAFYQKTTPRPFERRDRGYAPHPPTAESGLFVWSDSRSCFRKKAVCILSEDVILNLTYLMMRLLWGHLESNRPEHAAAGSHWTLVLSEMASTKRVYWRFSRSAVSDSRSLLRTLWSMSGIRSSDYTLLIQCSYIQFGIKSNCIHMGSIRYECVLWTLQHVKGAAVAKGVLVLQLEILSGMPSLSLHKCDIK